jgi:hypothetical protein
VPTVAVAGKPLRSGTISEPVVVIDFDAVLFATIGSLLAPVVPLIVEAPGVVGVPETVHVMAALGATVLGGVGVHDVISPAGSPLTAHAALVAAIAGDAAFVQVNVPE